MESLYIATCYLAPVILLICALLLILRRHDFQRRHLTLVGVYAVVSLPFIVRTVTIYYGVDNFSPNSVEVLVLMLLLSITSSLYPLRELFPRVKTNLFRLIYTPVFLLLLVFYFASLFGYDLLLVDVATARVLVYATNILYVVVPLLLVFRQPSERSLRVYVLMELAVLLITTLIFFGSDALCLNALGSVYRLVILAKCLIMTYIILFMSEGSRALIAETITEEPKIDEVTNCGDTPLWRRLEECMVSREPWRDPEVTIVSLANMIGSNRTTLSAEIQNHGYANYHSFIAVYRLQAFCAMAKSGDVVNVVDSFYAVGFRSMSSAYRHFKTIYGVTPNQFIASLSEGK